MLSLFKKKEKPSYQAYIQSLGKTVTVRHRQTLLEAALEAGLDYPYSCGAGSCTTCKTRLIEGTYKQLSDMSLVLSEDDRKKGYFLACQAIPLSDMIVTLEPDQARDFSGVIVGYQRLTHDILGIRVQLSERMNYTAGQYADIAVSGIKGTRSYSFASAPQAEGNTEVEFHIRLVPGGEMTPWFHASDRTGTQIALRGPRGSFGWHSSKAILLCIAGGSGMAPIKAMLEEAAQRGETRKIVYLYGARTQSDLYALDTMAKLQKQLRDFTFIPILSHEDPNSTWQGKRGLVTELISKQNIDFAATAAFLCGPPPMIDAAIAELKKCGVDPHEIYFDKFTDRSHILAR
ncbi:MAG: 2Fe-2S iron-sulfur cluster binding domain-containing protein [Turneriella sp.]|nr:2Fe-2S iron-sulfur cluster binding domain-containing protein [Turneriella sp.]